MFTTCFLFWRFCVYVTSTPYIITYCHTLSLHDALPMRIASPTAPAPNDRPAPPRRAPRRRVSGSIRQWVAGPSIASAHAHIADSAFHSFLRSEEHTSELQSLMRISYAVFCLKKKK